MRVGILDDDPLWCEKAESILKAYADNIGTEIEVSSFFAKDSLMEYEGEQIDVLFVDIVLEKGNPRIAAENGIDVAVLINAKWKNCQIVYLTNYLYYATDVYHTHHAYFVLKEQFEKRIPNIFEKIFHEMEQKTEKYIFTAIGGKELFLAAEDIRYFERRNRVTRIQTVWGSYETWEKIGEIYERLPQLDFVRCHNSYIVYLPAIRELNKGAVILDDGTLIDISRSYRKSVRQAFARWALTQMPS